MEHGYTQIQLAAVLEISLRTYQRIEYGQQKPNVHVVVRLQRLFRKDISEIMEPFADINQIKRKSLEQQTIQKH
ncbi:hypothetical protein ADH76_04590 [Enterocloster clostridioformis]|nr:hypothetical protein A4V08_35120 [Lachnoclostridium sp. YL32]NDO28212.1 helix-turn-helix transcriptional regulator [Enterocloster clostridioformis]OXE70657.1 hypothetical protein ADH76_04590 [Enterocloster clostridioformis]QQR04204.1 helix-turn-helix transcriptional regulator [Enterocloster clostridioformis]